jgi:hypothetical protein
MLYAQANWTYESTAIETCEPKIMDDPQRWAPAGADADTDADATFEKHSELLGPLNLGMLLN